MNNNDENNEFLNEIQQKINKRSGGLYYNKKLKMIKKNLTVTSLVVITVIILWALVNFIYQRISLDTKLIHKSPDRNKGLLHKPDTVKTQKAETQGIASQQASQQGIASLPDGENNIIKKQKYRYIFKPKNKINENEAKLIKKILKKYSRTEGKDYYIYLIPETEIKNILRLLFKMELNLKKEKYSDTSNYYQISINKEILDIIIKK